MNRPGAPILAFAVALLATGLGSACNSVQAPECANLVSAGQAFRGDISNSVFLFINGSDSACTLRAPTISLNDDAGIRLDVPQDWAPLANEQALRLDTQNAAAVPFTITPLQCSRTLRSSYFTAIFRGGLKVRVSVIVELCPGSRIRVWAPVPAQMCADGSFVWISPIGGGSGAGSGCLRPTP